jgi:carboxymethylenebutenolidase
MATLTQENIELESNGSRLTGLLVRPEGAGPWPGVVQIQEWWGIEPHVVEVAHRLAAEGFVVLVPDLYHGKVVTEPDEAQKAVMMLGGHIDRAVREIQVALETLQARSDVQPKRLGVMGFCVGGLLTWQVALRTPSVVGAAVPWYAGGFDPSPEQLADYGVPTLAIFGGQDHGIPPATVQKIEKILQGKAASRVLVYPEAGHAFLNPDHGMGHEESAKDAWPKAVAFLKDHLQ